MFGAEQILTVEKSNLHAFSEGLSSDDVAILVDWLNEKDDKIRYQSLLILQDRLTFSDDAFAYWDIFRDKLKSDNSYQRSIGLMMISGNTRWDKSGKFEELFDEFCALLHDDKPITVRQCIQSFKNIIPYKQNLCEKIGNALINIDIMSAKESMRKLMLIDVINILLLIRKTQNTEKIENYISKALTGGILDNKSKKAIQAGLLG